MEHFESLGGLLVGAVLAFFVRGWYETKNEIKAEDKDQNSRMDKIDSEMNALKLKVAVMEADMLSKSDVEDILSNKLVPITARMDKIDEHQESMNEKLSALTLDVRLILTNVRNDNNSITPAT